MPKWIITWNAGYGQSEEIIEAATESDASAEAYQSWLQEAESNADYQAHPYTKKLAVELCLEDEDE